MLEVGASLSSCFPILVSVFLSVSRSFESLRASIVQSVRLHLYPTVSKCGEPIRSLRAPARLWHFRNLLDPSSPSSSKSQARPGLRSHGLPESAPQLPRRHALVKGGAGSLATTREVTTVTRPPVGRGWRGLAQGRAQHGY